MKAPRISEKQFLAQVVQFARLHRWLVYHTHDSRRSARGFPDLVLVRGPRVIYAELKVGKNTTTPEQRDWIAALMTASQPTFVWRPEDWADIERILGAAAPAAFTA